MRVELRQTIYDENTFRQYVFGRPVVLPFTPFMGMRLSNVGSNLPPDDASEHSEDNVGVTCDEFVQYVNVDVPTGIVYCGLDDLYVREGEKIQDILAYYSSDWEKIVEYQLAADDPAFENQLEDEEDTL